MKTILIKLSLMALMATIGFSSCAQSVFGANRQTVKDSLIKEGYEFIQTRVGKDSVIYDDYINLNIRTTVNCYFDKDQRCFEYMQIMEKSKLIQKVESLNKSYVKVDGRHWINKDSNIKAWLYVSDEDWFYILYDII